MYYRFSFFFLFFVQFLLAQFRPSKHYTTAEGLPNNAVRTLFLDKSNILWIGTENGVCRLVNGQFYDVPQYEGLTNKSCWDISQDSRGNMWFASYGGGVSTFDGKKISVFTQKNGLPSNKIRKVFPFKNKMFVGTELGIAIIDIYTHKIQKVIGNVPHFDVFIVTDLFTYKNEIFFSTVNEGLFKIDFSGNTPQNVAVLEYTVTGKDTDRHAYSLGQFGDQLLISDKNFVSQFALDDLNKGRNLPYKTFGKSVIWQYAKDKNNLIYASAWGIFENNGGLYRVGNYQMTDVSDVFGIDSKSLLNVVYDTQQDLLYVGSKDKGIYQIRLDNVIDYENFDGNSVIDFETIGSQKVILHNKGITFLNDNNFNCKKVFLADFKSKELEFIRNSKKKLPKHEDGFFELNYEIPAKGIEFYNLVKHHNSLWVSSNIGLFELDFMGTIRNYVPIHTQVFGFTPDNYFFETNPYGGIHLYDDVYNLKSILFDEKVSAIVQTVNLRDKSYLVSVFRGLFEYRKRAFRSYLDENVFKEQKIKHITSNYKGELIISAEFGDVYVLNTIGKFEILKKISKKQITGKTINFLETYKDYILIGTEKGITIYHNGIIRLIDEEQGFKDCIIQSSRIFKNELWLGTQKGYYKIDLNKLLAQQKEVKELDITGISINNVPLKDSDFIWFNYASNKIVTDYKHNTFFINLLPKGHPYPNKLKFRYRLNSKNSWSIYRDEPNIFLSYLPFGNYNLQVEVWDANSGNTRIFDVLNIIVNPPFWFSWWFITLLFLILISGVILIFLRYKKKIKVKAQTEKRLAEIKLDALLSQMNPHFTFNAMNTIQDFIISNDVDNSLMFIGDLARLMRQILDNSSKKTISLKEEILFLKTYISLENLRFDNKVTINFSIDKEIDLFFVKIPAMVLQPFIENVFVHAFNENHPNPTLDITFTLRAIHILECQISDNGKGKASFQKNKLHQSKGSSLTSERLSLLQPEIKNPITSVFTETKGTIVTILLKI